jgi:hypothetical protein
MSNRLETAHALKKTACLARGRLPLYSSGRAKISPALNIFPRARYHTILIVKLSAVVRVCFINSIYVHRSIATELSLAPHIFCSPLLALHTPPHLTGMPPHRRGLSRFRGVRGRSNETFYSELCIGGFRLTFGTYDTSELATCAYDAAAWRLGCPWCDLNFPDLASLAEAEFLAPPPRLVTDEDPHHHRHSQHRLLIAERNERLMQQ